MEFNSGFKGLIYELDDEKIGDWFPTNIFFHGYFHTIFGTLPAPGQWLPWVFSQSLGNSVKQLSIRLQIVPEFKNGATCSLTSVPLYVISGLLN